MTAAYGALDARVRDARRDPGLVALEGVHPVKHALRFGATLVLTVTPDRAAAAALLADLAPDVALPTDALEVDRSVWRALTATRPPTSPLLAFAQRPTVTAGDVLDREGLVVALEAPRHLGNVGAAIRVAAAADAAGVLVIGDVDPWHPACVRGAAGLQFALPVTRTDTLPATARPIAAVDPSGGPITQARGLADAVLVFGTERAGLSEVLRSRAACSVAVPMRAGVSSLNLATAVAACLYSLR